MPYKNMPLGYQIYWTVLHNVVGLVLWLDLSHTQLLGRKMIQNTFVPLVSKEFDG